MKNSPTIILVHGAFHGAWCWQMVTDYIDRQGVQSVAINLPGKGSGSIMGNCLTDCASYLHGIIAASEGPVILCGHSLGGATITEVVDQTGRICHLVYLAALVPDADECAVDYAPEILTGEVGNASSQTDEGMIMIDPRIAGTVFYHDCDPNIADWAISQLCSQNPTLAMTPLSQASWRHCQSTYVICEQDRALPVAAQERLAIRCDSVVRWQTGHSPMLSRPELVGDFLVDIAQKFAN